ncbi:MAG: hypothetical protein EBZ59_12120, partial [Planctomycetia bacterium]|nr:hypothetical protein [Planctomycetia bacterium]
ASAIEILSGGTRVGYFDSLEPEIYGLWAVAKDFVNQGSLVARGGGVLTLDGESGTAPTWANEGTFAVDGGTLNLGGRFTMDRLGTFTRSGGTVNITGVLDNAGRTLALPAGTGEWQLMRGTIRGGRIEAMSGTSLVVRVRTANANIYDDFGTLDGVELATDLRVGWPPVGTYTATEMTGRLVVANGLRLDGGRILLGDSLGAGRGTLALLGGTQAVTGTGEIVMGKSDYNTIDIGGDANARVGSPSGSVTIGSGVTIRGASGRFTSDYSRPGRLVNEGLIAADGATPFSSDLAYESPRLIDATAGTVYTNNYGIGTPIDTSGAANPLPPAAYTTFGSSQWSRPMAYVLDGFVAGAVYRVRLHFVELNYSSPGYRRLDVDINGVRKLDDFDLFTAAGGNNKAIDREFDVVADASGRIRVVLATRNGTPAVVSAIEVFDAGVRVVGIDVGSRAGGFQIETAAFENRGRIAIPTDGSVNLRPGWSSGPGGRIDLTGGKLLLGG